MRWLFKLMTTFIVIAIPYVSFGTATEGFTYRSGNVRISLDMSVSRLSNGYTNTLDGSFGHILGLANILTRLKGPFNITFWNHSGRLPHGPWAIYAIRQLEAISDKQHEATHGDTSIKELIEKVIAPYLKVKIRPVKVFKGYTIRLAYTKTRTSAMKELDRLNPRYSGNQDFQETLDFGSQFFPAWVSKIHTGKYGIYYGLYSSFREALAAGRTYRLGKKHFYIFPIQFKCKDLHKYIK